MIYGLQRSISVLIVRRFFFFYFGSVGFAYRKRCFPVIDRCVSYEQ